MAQLTQIYSLIYSLISLIRRRRATFFKRLINNGTVGQTDIFIIREVRLVNFFSYVVLVSLTIGLTNTFFIHNKFPELAALLLFVTSIFSLVFNYYKKNKFLQALFYLCCYVGDGTGGMPLTLQYSCHYCTSLRI